MADNRRADHPRRASHHHGRNLDHERTHFRYSSLECPAMTQRGPWVRFGSFRYDANDFQRLSERPWPSSLFQRLPYQIPQPGTLLAVKVPRGAVLRLSRRAAVRPLNEKRPQLYQSRGCQPRHPGGWGLNTEDSLSLPQVCESLKKQDRGETLAPTPRNFFLRDPALKPARRSSLYAGGVAPLSLSLVQVHEHGRAGILSLSERPKRGAADPYGAFALIDRTPGCHETGTSMKAGAAAALIAYHE